VDLDLTPTNVLTAGEIYNERGVLAYFSGVYATLPMEDFKYSTNNEGGASFGYNANNNVWSYWNYTGEMTNRNNYDIRTHVAGYWGNAFNIIRQANTLIHDLPDYPELSDQAPAWIAEAKFIRAYVYFQLAKRYGGLPKILESQVLDPNDYSTLWVARVSHADTYDFILKDLDDAIADMPPTSDAGRANKYVAAALKSRAALHAATTARYGSAQFPDWTVDGVLLQGIPSNRANDYFKQAWDAAKLVEESGRYELHRGNANLRENYVEIWEKAGDNKESIWLRKYDFTTFVHSYDVTMSPPRMAMNGDRFNPTLDWVELFDGLPLNDEGRFHAFDSDGHYIVYDDEQQLWNSVEPRLYANLLIPGNVYRGIYKLEMHAGTFVPSVDPDVQKLKKLSIDNGSNSTYSGSWNTTNYPENPFTTNLSAPESGKLIVISNLEDNRLQTSTSLYTVDLDGKKLSLRACAFDAPRTSFTTLGTNTTTGFFGHKHLDLNLTREECVNNGSTQPWIEIRYAEVLLNRAEAAIELAQNGETMYGGVDMLQDAFECINDIRSRAGATLLANVAELSTANAFSAWNRPGPKGQGGFVVAPNRALQILRVERYKELAFESKIYWDLLRWFSYHDQINNYVRRGLYSFMFSKGVTVDEENGFAQGKYIYDAKGSEMIPSGNISFNTANYYERIPTTELSKNPLLQPNRNQ
jgi:hypothetical protein